METSVITYVKYFDVCALVRFRGRDKQISGVSKAKMLICTCIRVWGAEGGREREREKTPLAYQIKFHSCLLSFRPLILSQPSSPLATGA